MTLNDDQSIQDEATHCEMTYTWTLRNSMLAEGVWGIHVTEKATTMAVTKVTVVKKPKTF